MSDGPYKSLPLSSKWKKVAKYAESDAYTDTEICEAVTPALSTDWRLGELGDTAKALRSIFDDSQGSLFDRLDQLESLSQASAGNGLRQILVQCAMQHASAGETGAGAVEAASADAMAIWASRHGRPIEEHYCRKWDAERAANVRGRIEDGIKKVSFTDVARSLLGETRPIPRASKHGGVDQGPDL